jgi:hypothetical protein
LVLSPVRRTELIDNKLGIFLKLWAIIPHRHVLNFEIAGPLGGFFLQNMGIGKCSHSKPTNSKTSTKTVNKRGGKTRDRGRGKK